MVSTSPTASPLAKLEGILQGTDTPSDQKALAFIALWGVATAILVMIGGKAPDVSFGLAVGILFTALLLTGRRVGWW